MIDSEYSADSYKSLKISIEAKTKNPEMLRFAPDHLKTKTMCVKMLLKSCCSLYGMFLVDIRLKKCGIKLF